MFIVYVKTRGKVLKLPHGDLVRTPRRVKIKNKDELRTFLSVLNTQCIHDFEVTETNDKMDIRDSTKRQKYNNETSISIGGKISGRQGG